MLDPDKLKDEILTGIRTTIVPAIERMELMKMPVTSEAGNELAKDVATAFDDIVSEPLAEILANAIDYYVKNISITGTIITNGSPTTHVTSISSTPVPSTNGKIPNTLGIS